MSNHIIYNLFLLLFFILLCQILKYCLYLHTGTINDTDQLLEFAKLGVYCQFDLFGLECSFYQFNEKFDMPSDGQRMESVVALVNNGFEDRILISHDIHTKHRLVCIYQDFNIYFNKIYERF